MQHDQTSVATSESFINYTSSITTLMMVPLDRSTVGLHWRQKGIGEMTLEQATPTYPIKAIQSW